MQVLKKNLKKLKNNPKKSVMGSVKSTNTGQLLRNVCGKFRRIYIGIVCHCNIRNRSEILVDRLIVGCIGISMKDWIKLNGENYFRSLNLNSVAFRRYNQEALSRLTPGRRIRRPGGRNVRNCLD